MPKRINVPVQGAASFEVAKANAEFVASLNLPNALDCKPVTVKKLAVAGSSPGIDFKALSEWDGDIWAANGTCALLAERGIGSTMITVDPFNYDMANEEIDILFGRVKKALIATNCGPRIVDFLHKNHCEIATFNVLPWEPDYIGGGPTTATRAPILALRMGYEEISFFGLEGSFYDKSHFYKDAVGDWHYLTIEAGGKRYKSCVELMMQCEHLAAIIKNFPGIFKDRSGGLLGAMVENFDTWEVVDMSPELRASEIAA